ncbi:hypothetical protein RsTz2092_13850 [Deferribacterales bacterium RsTz2092]|nr:hypothetical protein AGMMS49941_13350 [Deferribacterales bacterium]
MKRLFLMALGLSMVLATVALAQTITPRGDVLSDDSIGGQAQDVSPQSPANTHSVTIYGGLAYSLGKDRERVSLDGENKDDNSQSGFTFDIAGEFYFSKYVGIALGYQHVKDTYEYEYNNANSDWEFGVSSLYAMVLLRTSMLKTEGSGVPYFLYVGVGRASTDVKITNDVDWVSLPDTHITRKESVGGVIADIGVVILPTEHLSLQAKMRYLDATVDKIYGESRQMAGISVIGGLGYSF